MSDELMLDSMGATPTGFEIKTHAGGPQTAETLLFIADSMRSVLDGYDAPNYVEMEVKGTDGKRYIMTLQRQGKVTPHGARMAAEAALDAAKADALEEAAQDFEDNIGVGEFDELARRDGARWNHIEDAWEYQGPYMDWLRARAVALRAPE